MKDDLRTDLQHCLDQLGENEGDITNLLPQLRDLEKIRHSILDLFDHLRHIHNLSNEIKDLAGSIPPITSMTMLILGSDTID